MQLTPFLVLTAIQRFSTDARPNFVQFANLHELPVSTQKVTLYCFPHVLTAATATILTALEVKFNFVFHDLSFK